MSSQFDQEILQDFLTESGELLAQLEGDLVVLEATPKDPELLNQVFRALHTIKGSASFLQLTNLVRLAHAAESALNAARNGAVAIDARAMNLLLEAVDVLKQQMGQLAAGEPLVEARGGLVAALSALGEGKSGGHHAASDADAAPPVRATHATVASTGGGRGASHKLELGPGKADLLPYLIADLDETLAKVRSGLEAIANDGKDATSAGQLPDTLEQLSRCVDFFECGQMSDLAQAMARASLRVARGEAAAGAVVPHLRSLCELVGAQAQGIKEGEVREVSAQDALDALRVALDAPPASATAPDKTAPGRVPASEAQGRQDGAIAADKQDRPEKQDRQDKPKDDHDASRKAQGENTIRVDVQRLEALMNLVGELVLQKNRITALTRRVAQQEHRDAELGEALAMASGSLDRVTSDIQVAVMRTRMQPLDKLFGRYPRLIRDLAAKTGKKISLAIEGGETEVDKSVIEELGDPLVHLIRNSADHGLEGPAERTSAGKPEGGTITLRASHEGSQVRVQVIDDGRGLSRERIGRKAVERGLVTQEQLAGLSDREVWAFIFEAGFSTADQVSDLSGRGVGMDVVRTNIQKLKGAIELDSQPGKGTTITITIPLTVAILQAMMVGVGREIYAVPLTSILEIVRPSADLVSSIGGGTVMRLRDAVLPLVQGAELFDQPQDQRAEAPFAVVLQMGGKRVGLMVSRLIGQQEVVTKPLDEALAAGRKAVSGATVRDDGGVSLIVDVERLIGMAQGSAGRSE